MSVSDPLIKEIKELTAIFLSDFDNNKSITDNHAYLQPFCTCVEKIFNKGLRPQFSSFGFVKHPNVWTWVKESQNYCSSFNLDSAFYVVDNCKSVNDSTGQFRLFIRACLVKRCLHMPVAFLAKNQTFQSLYHINSSILGDEILVQIFQSVLMQCGKFTFNLDLNNSSFLDLSWSLPKVLSMELVPCKSLGISVTYAFEKAVIIDVRPNSVAAEDGNIEVGDVLDELNGIHLNAVTRGYLGKIMKKGTGKPIILKIIKARISDTELYLPAIPLLKHIKIDVETFRQKFSKSKIEIPSRNPQTTSAGYEVTYLGNISTGHSGEVKEIEKAIKVMLTHFKNLDSNNIPKIERIKRVVSFEIGEIGVRCVVPENGEEIMTHSYMEISSCGTVNNLKHYFAYIAGDDICNVAKNFKCFIFYCKNDRNVTTVLESIGQGFLRTHYAV